MIKTLPDSKALAIFVNSYGYQSEIPFGGYKMSGIGREDGAEAIHEYSQAKSVTVGLERFESRFEVQALPEDETSSVKQGHTIKV
jgi:hypothetical protein